MRKILAIFSAFLFVGLLTACDPGSDGTATATPSANTSVSSGIGSKDATADIKIGTELKTDEFSPYVNVTVTNNSTETSDYYVTVTLNSADGTEQIADGVLFVDSLKAGQIKKDKITFLIHNDEVPKNAVVTLETVQRTATL